MDILFRIDFFLNEGEIRLQHFKKAVDKAKMSTVTPRVPPKTEYQRARYKHRIEQRKAKINLLQKRHDDYEEDLKIKEREKAKSTTK